METHSQARRVLKFIFISCFKWGWAVLMLVGNSLTDCIEALRGEIEVKKQGEHCVRNNISTWLGGDEWSWLARYILLNCFCLSFFREESGEANWTGTIGEVNWRRCPLCGL